MQFIYGGGGVLELLFWVGPENIFYKKIVYIITLEKNIKEYFPWCLLHLWPPELL